MTESALSPSEQVASLWELGGLSWRELGKRVWSEIDKDDLLNRAYEVAYNFMLSFFPLLLFLVAVFGILASHGSTLRYDLFYYFQRALPADAYGVVTRTLDEVTRNAGAGKLSFGLLFTLYAGSGGIMQLISTLNSAYGVRERRSWLKVHLLAIALTAGIAVFVFGGLLLLLGGGHVAEYLGAKIGLSSAAVAIWKVLQWVLAFGFIIVAFAIIYYYAPNVKERHWYWITPGSVVGVLLWVAASAAFRLYLHYFNSYSKTYGSLGAVIILMIWFYVTGLAFLIGGEINAVIEQAAAERGHPEAKAEGRQAA
ncbi:MAG: YihY/virulence factor BrkB family protein [Acidobacteria bacterium]|nr:YihY/virulence factor BrkB family protein [Acidobacteriota bacterium]